MGEIMHGKKDRVIAFLFLPGRRAVGANAFQ
jgi:hypothetical protein